MMNWNEIDVHLIAGQSNAVGCTKMSTLPPRFKIHNFERAYLYQEGNFTLHTNAKLIQGITTGMGNNPEHIGIEYGISEVLNKYYHQPFALIRYAFGGSTLCYDWAPRTKWPGQPEYIGHMGYHYDRWSRTVINGMNRLIEKGYRPIIKSLSWMQGESDADKDEAIAADYLGNLNDMVDCMRVELRIPELKVIVGEIATRPPLCPWSDVVKKAQREWTERDNHAKFISTDDLPIGKDGLHFDAAEDLELGRRFGKAILEHLSLEK